MWFCLPRCLGSSKILTQRNPVWEEGRDKERTKHEQRGSHPKHQRCDPGLITYTQQLITHIHLIISQSHHYNYWVFIPPPKKRNPPTQMSLYSDCLWKAPLFKQIVPGRIPRRSWSRWRRFERSHLPLGWQKTAYRWFPGGGEGRAWPSRLSCRRRNHRSDNHDGQAQLTVC